jgi:hypothetical protein
MHFLGASRDGLVARRVDLDTISSSVGLIHTPTTKSLADLKIPTHKIHKLMTIHSIYGL